MQVRGGSEAAGSWPYWQLAGDAGHAHCAFPTMDWTHRTGGRAAPARASGCECRWPPCLGRQWGAKGRGLGGHRVQRSGSTDAFAKVRSGPTLCQPRSTTPLTCSPPQTAGFPAAAREPARRSTRRPPAGHRPHRWHRAWRPARPRWRCHHTAGAQSGGGGGMAGGPYKALARIRVGVEL